MNSLMVLGKLHRTMGKYDFVKGVIGIPSYRDPEYVLQSYPTTPLSQE